MKLSAAKFLFKNRGEDTRVYNGTQKTTVKSGGTVAVSFDFLKEFERNKCFEFIGVGEEKREGGQVEEKKISKK